MASLTKENDRGRVGYRLRFYQSGKRRTLWLGNVSKRAAERITRNVDDLVEADAAGIAPPPAAIKWATDVDERLHRNLERWGLVDPRGTVDADGRLCRVFFEAWIVKNCDNERTANNYRQAVGWFIRHVGNDRTLSSVTPADFADWLRWMVHPERLAQSTANKHAKRIRTLFKKAIAARLLTDNPGTGTKIGSEVNRDRDHYVSIDDAGKIITAADPEWALMFGLCRFAGLRCPSEVIGLRWSDIDWAAGRMRIDSSKTGLRFCPLWPRLRPLLNAQWDAAADGSVYVIGRNRDSESNLRTQLGRIVERAGLVMWPKGFVNLRASCRTDLEEQFPGHVCDAWMGHSSKVAAKHYLQVTDDHWDRATGGAENRTAGPPVNQTAVPLDGGGPAGGPIGAHRCPF